MKRILSFGEALNYSSEWNNNSGSVLPSVAVLGAGLDSSDPHGLSVRSKQNARVAGELIRWGAVERDVAIVSGHGPVKLASEAVTEADGMSKIIHEAYPMTPVMEDRQSTDTYQNVCNIAAIAGELGKDYLTIIASDAQLRRFDTIAYKIMPHIDLDLVRSAKDGLREKIIIRGLQTGFMLSTLGVHIGDTKKIDARIKKFYDPIVKPAKNHVTSNTLNGAYSAK